MEVDPAIPKNRFASIGIANDPGVATNQINCVAHQGGWAGKLNLDFYHAGKATHVHYSHSGPLRAQRPFYPERPRTDVCHLYLLHPPGGVVGGDRLSVNASCHSGSHCVVTTPGATKFYRSAAMQSNIRQSLFVAPGGVMEWLPQENIFFNSCNVLADTRIELASGAGFCGWDIQCFGRPAGDQGFVQGNVAVHFSVTRDGQPLLLERLHQCANAESVSADVAGRRTLQQATGMREFTVNGMLVLQGSSLIDPAQQSELLGLLRKLHNADAGKSNYEMAITAVDGLVIARFLGHRADQAKQLFSDIRASCRPILFGLGPHEPRIWAT